MMSLYYSRYLSVQGSAKRRAPGLVNVVPAVAHLFCLTLPTALTQPGIHLFSLALYYPLPPLSADVI